MGAITSIDDTKVWPGLERAAAGNTRGWGSSADRDACTARSIYSEAGAVLVPNGGIYRV